MEPIPKSSQASRSGDSTTAVGMATATCQPDAGDLAWPRTTVVPSRLFPQPTPDSPSYEANLASSFWPISRGLLLATTISLRSLINQYRSIGRRDMLPSTSISFSGDRAIPISPATPSARRIGALTIQAEPLTNRCGLKSDTWGSFLSMIALTRCGS